MLTSKHTTSPVYLLFGKAGSGKSFIGDYLQCEHGFIHFEGDAILTAEMKDCVRQGDVMSTTMIDRYMDDLKQQIRHFYQHATQPVAISQGMYRNKNRLDLLREFPHLQFVWVKANDAVCYQRIKQRNNAITVEYARKITAVFEPPQGFNYTIIDNKTHNHMEKVFKNWPIG